MPTTIEAHDKDHARFIQAKLSHAAQKGKQISNADFFTELLDRWIKKVQL